MIRRLVLRAALMIVRCAILILVVVSMVQVFNTIAEIVRDLEKDNEILLLGALVAALVPSGAMLFWACNAVAVRIYVPIKEGVPIFSEIKSRFNRPGTPSTMIGSTARSAGLRPPHASPASSHDRAAGIQS
jgi:hypothetical protein